MKSERISNAKRKGEGNRKNGNRYLAWAFIEAAHFGIIWAPKIKAYYQRKWAKRVQGTRVVRFSPIGERKFRKAFGL